MYTIESVIARINKSSRIEPFILFITSPILFFFIWWNLTSYPITSGWDEGIYLQFSRNLSHYGLYATHDGNQYDTLIPSGGTGPILIGSVALAFKLFGDSLFTARNIMAVYLTLSVVGLYLLIREISRWEVAVLCMFVYLVAGYNSYDTLWMGRQVLAEIPAFAFLFFGLWSLIKFLKKYNGLLLATSLVLLGLSIITKNQLIWILTPTLTVMAFLDILSPQRQKWKYYLSAACAGIIGYLAWYLTSMILVGNEKTFYEQTQTAVLIASFLRINSTRAMESTKLFLKSGFLIPIGLSFIQITFTAIGKKKRQNESLTIFLILTAFGLFATIIMGLPWARYIYTGIVLSIPLLALSMDTLISWLMSRRYNLYWIISAVTLLIFTGFITVKLAADSSLITKTNNDDAVQFAQLVDRTVPAGDEVLNWEWEIEFYSHSIYIHPDFRLFPALIDHIYNQMDSPILHQQRIPRGVYYLVEGPFAGQTGLFEPINKTGDLTPLGHVGAYSLFYINLAKQAQK